MLYTVFNKIKSIESISFLNMDSLEKLDLSKLENVLEINFVSNLKALNKCKFAQLKILDLSRISILSKRKTHINNSKSLE
jgi:hypothetical protein